MIFQSITSLFPPRVTLWVSISALEKRPRKARNCPMQSEVLFLTMTTGSMNEAVSGI